MVPRNNFGTPVPMGCSTFGLASPGWRQGRPTHHVRVVRRHLPQDVLQLPAPLQGRQGQHTRWHPDALQVEQVPPGHQELHAAGDQPREREQHRRIARHLPLSQLPRVSRLMTCGIYIYIYIYNIYTVLIVDYYYECTTAVLYLMPDVLSTDFGCAE